METPSHLSRFRSAVQRIMDQRVHTSGTGTEADTLNLDTPTTQNKKMHKARTLDVLPVVEISPRTNRPRNRTTIGRLFTTFLGRQDSMTNEPVTPPSPNGNKTNKLQSLVKSLIKSSKKTHPVVQKALGPEGCRKKFFRAFQILRILHRLHRISEDIQLYGTSSNLFDLTTRDRTRVKKILYPSVLDETSEQLNEEKGMKWYIIHPKSRVRLVWSFVILVVLAYTATITPYRLVFENTSPTFWVVVDYCVDVLFLIDFVMNFVNAYYDEEGKLVKDPSTLVKKYLKSWFIIDALAVFPFDLLQSVLDTEALSISHTNINTFVRLFRLPRLYKVMRIMRINNIFNFLKGSPILEWVELHSVFVKLFSFFVVVVTGMHIAACIWYFPVTLDPNNPNTWVARGNLNGASNFSIYITSLYYIFTTLATVGYGDIHSGTVIEKVLSLALMSLGVAFYSFTIGLIASTLSARENRESALKRKISIANEFADEIKAPRALKSKIAKILEYNSYRNCFSWADKKQIFGEIPISLRYDIVMSMHNGILQSIPFFREHSDKYFVVTIAEVLKPLRVKPRDYLWKESDSAESMYFLIAGKVHLISSEFLTPEDRVNNQKTSIIFKRFMSGSYFGEIELIYKRERKYSLQASSEAELFYLTKHDYFNVLVREFPHIHEEFKEIALERDRRNIDSLIEIKNFLEAHIPDDGRRATTIMATKLNTKLLNKEINSKQSLEPMSTTSIEAFPTFTNINLALGSASDQKVEEDEPATSVFPQLKINNLFPKSVPIQNRRKALDVDSEIRKLSTFYSSPGDGPISLLGKLHKKAKKGKSNSSSNDSASNSNSLSNILEKSDHSGSSDDDSSSSDSDSSSNSQSQSQSQSESRHSDESLSKSAAAKMNSKISSKINIGPPNAFGLNSNPPNVYSFPAAQYYRSKSSSFLKTLQGGTPTAKSQTELLRRASTQKFKRRSREKSLLKLAIGADTEELSPQIVQENKEEKKLVKEWKTVKEEGDEETAEIRRKQAVYEVKKVQKKGEKKVASLKSTIKDSDERIRNLEDRFQRVIKNVQNVMQE